MQRLEVSGAVRHIYIYISLGVKGLININTNVNWIPYKLTILHYIYQLLCLIFVKWPDDGRYGRHC
jgi:hypothetical protein